MFEPCTGERGLNAYPGSTTPSKPSPNYGSIKNPFCQTTDILLSLLFDVSTTVMWERSQWLGKNIVRSAG